MSETWDDYTSTETSTDTSAEVSALDSSAAETESANDASVLIVRRSHHRHRRRRDRPEQRRHQDWADWNAASADEWSASADSYNNAGVDRAQSGDSESAQTDFANAANYADGASNYADTASGYADTADSWVQQAATIPPRSTSPERGAAMPFARMELVRTVAAPVATVRTALTKTLREQHFDLTAERLTSLEGQRGSQLAGGALQPKKSAGRHQDRAHRRRRRRPRSSVSLFDRWRAIGGKAWGNNRIYAELFTEIAEAVDRALRSARPRRDADPADVQQHRRHHRLARAHQCRHRQRRREGGASGSTSGSAALQPATPTGPQVVIAAPDAEAILDASACRACSPSRCSSRASPARCRRRWRQTSSASPARSSTCSGSASPGMVPVITIDRDRQAGRHVPQRAGPDPRVAAAADACSAARRAGTRRSSTPTTSAWSSATARSGDQRLPRRQHLQLRGQPVHPRRPDPAAGQDGPRLRLPALPGVGRRRAARRLLPELRRAARRGGPAQVRALRARFPPGAGTRDAVAAGRHRRRAVRSPAAASAPLPVAPPSPSPRSPQRRRPRSRPASTPIRRPLRSPLVGRLPVDGAGDHQRAARRRRRPSGADRSRRAITGSAEKCPHLAGEVRGAETVVDLVMRHGRRDVGLHASEKRGEVGALAAVT